MEKNNIKNDNFVVIKWY